MTAADGGSALLVLEDGRAFEGEAFGAVGESFGEMVFNTGMTGYQETLTDPSYCGQIVAMTAPHIGNTGVNDEDPESSRIWVAGYVVRDPSRRASSWRCKRSLPEELAAQGIVGISGVDTRALTRHLRERGAMRVGIASDGTSRDDLLAAVRAAPAMTGAKLADEVSTAEPYNVPAIGERRFRLAAVDLGVKAATLRRLAERGVETIVLPAATYADIAATGADALFLSNGPGDPATADAQVDTLRDALAARLPFFGICFGHQVFGRALGLPTRKLGYGHRGINQPVVDLATGRVEITAHNHGFCVQPRAGADPDRFDTDFGPARVTHRNLNDDVVEGLALLDQPAFSVQYHPEAAAGPHDAGYLFDRFTTMVLGQRAAAGREAADA